MQRSNRQIKTEKTLRISKSINNQETFANEWSKDARLHYVNNQHMHF